MQLKTGKGKLLFLLLFILLFPSLQQKFGFFVSAGLRGAVSGAPNPSFSWEKWWEGAYQKQKTDFFNDSIGCRSDLVRLNNQLDFSIFKKRHARNVVFGQDDYLFEQPYIDEYYGLDFCGEDKIRTVATQLKKIQDTLERMGKTFVFLYAPSKAYYFPGKLPGRTSGCQPGAPTNYTTLKRIADAEGIQQIDYNAWFLSMKNKTQDLLLSRLGTHWTIYGSLLAADSLIKYLEHKRNIQMPELTWQQVTHNNTPREMDDDLVTGLNLIFPVLTERFSYPEPIYDHTGNKTMPKVLYIGDSFLWVWRYDRLMQNISNEFDIFYYFKESWNQNTFSKKEPPGKVDDIDWHSKLLSNDCIIMLYVPPNFKSFTDPESPVTKLYHYFYPAESI